MKWAECRYETNKMMMLIEIIIIIIIIIISCKVMASFDMSTRRLFNRSVKMAAQRINQIFTGWSQKYHLCL